MLPPEVNEQQFVVAHTGASPLSGFRITPANPPTPGITNDIDTQKLQYDTYSIRNVYTWEAIAPFVASAGDDQYCSVKEGCPSKEAGGAG